MRLRAGLRAACSTLLAAQCVSALELDLSSPQSIKQAARAAADGMMLFYPGNRTGGIPGLFGDPYYWWEGGAAMGALIDYWYYTGDASYNSVATEALLWQVGPDANYMPPNQSLSLGNDDQAFWALAAMSAAEVAFPNPPGDQPQWLPLVQAVYNSQVERWNTEACGGGLKWQIYSTNIGYTYRNSISNGCFFNMAGRLGAYTRNSTYLDWATRTWEWATNPSIGLINENYQVFDGTNDVKNCSGLNPVQWSYNNGVFLLGAATMWNQTEGAEQELWRTRVEGLLTGARVFFQRDTGIMTESACEPSGNCNVDQRSFKAYLGRWMAATTKVAPWTHDTIIPLLQTSAQAAATSCSGGDTGTTCGMRWTTGEWDGQTGVGEQMSALEVIQSNLIDLVPGPVSQARGGISKSDPNAGTVGLHDIEPPSAITTADRAGAGILTALVITILVGGTWWLVR